MKYTEYVLGHFLGCQTRHRSRRSFVPAGNGLINNFVDDGFSLTSHSNCYLSCKLWAIVSQTKDKVFLDQETWLLSAVVQDDIFLASKGHRSFTSVVSICSLSGFDLTHSAFYIWMSGCGPLAMNRLLLSLLVLLLFYYHLEVYAAGQNAFGWFSKGI